MLDTAAFPDTKWGHRTLYTFLLSRRTAGELKSGSAPFFRRLQFLPSYVNESIPLFSGVRVDVEEKLKYALAKRKARCGVCCDNTPMP